MLTVISVDFLAADATPLASEILYAQPKRKKKQVSMPRLREEVGQACESLLHCLCHELQVLEIFPSLAENGKYEDISCLLKELQERVTDLSKIKKFFWEETESKEKKQATAQSLSEIGCTLAAALGRAQQGILVQVANVLAGEKDTLFFTASRKELESYCAQIEKWCAESKKSVATIEAFCEKISTVGKLSKKRHS